MARKMAVTALNPSTRLTIQSVKNVMISSLDVVIATSWKELAIHVMKEWPKCTSPLVFAPYAKTDGL